MSETDSDSGNERVYGYTPVLAEKIKGSPSITRPQSARQWPQDTMNVYTNELFHEPEEDGGASSSAQHHGTPSARPGSAQKMMQQKSSLAARRQERMQANIFQPNESMRQAGSPAPRPPARHGDTDGAYGMGQRPGQRDDNNVYGMRASYDPNEEMMGQTRSVIPRTPPPQPRLDLSDIRSFLMQPGPRTGPVMCYIVRDKGSTKMSPKYNLFLEDGKRFLLAARKRAAITELQKSSNYVVSLDYDDLGRESDKFFGKLRSNFVGTEFTIFDGGSKKNKGPGTQRQELGCVTYQYNVLGTRGPRKMTGVIPALDNNGNKLFQPTSESDTTLERLKKGRGLDDLVIMRNKPPRWNDELNAYCLNFNGRVTEASVKNFQLVTDDNMGYVILQFGKIGKNTFTMDYQWPMSAFQAFCICLSSFDGKLACE